MSENQSIFISHITSEKEIAFLLSRYIKSIYPNLSDIYVSNDIRSNPAGGNWLETIINALKKADIHITICSKNSMRKPWIHIETGHPFVMKKPIICIYHSGISRDQASFPYSSFQGLDIDHEGFASDFFNSLGKYLGPRPLPSNELKSFTREIASVVDSIKQIKSSDENGEAVSDAEQSEIEEIEELILVAFSKLGDKKLSFDEIERSINENYEYKRHEAEINYYITQLVDRGYLDMNYENELSLTYWLDHKGREYLVKNGLLYVKIIA